MLNCIAKQHHTPLGCAIRRRFGSQPSHATNNRFVNLEDLQAIECAK